MPLTCVRPDQSILGTVARNLDIMVDMEARLVGSVAEKQQNPNALFRAHSLGIYIHSCGIGNKTWYG